MINNVHDYRIIYYYSFDDECYLATIPELGGCIADGQTPLEAIRNVRETAKEWFDIANNENWEIPKPTATVFPEGKPLHLSDVAAYILSKTGNITTKALQKLSYYCKAWSCGWYKKPLFPEVFQAWSGGPINAELFQQHKGKRIVKPSFFDFCEIQELSEHQKAFVDKILEVYGEMNPDELGKMTHKEDPWLRARKGLPDDASSAEPISEEDMIEFYGLAA